MTATATATRITFETESCTRCGGSGTMPFTIWGGKCFKCAGSGSQLTKAGRAAYARRLRFLDSLPQVPVTELQAGDRIRNGSGWITVLAPIDPDARPAAWRIVGEERLPLLALLCREGRTEVRHCVDADATRQRHPGFAAIEAALTKKNGEPYAGVVFA